MNKELSGAFGDKGTKVNSVAYGHPHAAVIIESAKKELMLSTRGQGLLKVLNERKVPLQILKGTGVSGFSPEMMTVFIQVPGKVTTLTASFLIDLIKSLREAAQEIGGFKAPDPTKDVIAYAEFIHARNMDSIMEICRVVNELTKSSLFPDLLDTLAKLGLNGVHQACIRGASKEEVFVEYATAYNSSKKGN